MCVWALHASDVLPADLILTADSTPYPTNASFHCSLFQPMPPSIAVVQSCGLCPEPISLLPGLCEDHWESDGL